MRVYYEKEIKKILIGMHARGENRNLRIFKGIIKLY